MELKGTDVKHAIEQLRVSIQTIREFTDDRSAYVVSTNVAPALTTTIQRAKRDFRNNLHAELICNFLAFFDIDRKDIYDERVYCEEAI